MRNIIPMELIDLNSSIDMAVRPTYGGLPEYGVASGDIASFITNINYPLKKLEAGIKAVQNLNGYDHPWAGGAGKNILKVTNFTVGQSKTARGVTCTYNEDGSFTLNGTSTQDNAFWNLDYVEGSQNVQTDVGLKLVIETISESVQLQVSATSGLKAGANALTSPVTFTLSSSEASTWARLQVPTSGTVLNNVKVYPMIMLATETDTAYVPYENICPISGFSEVNVTRTGLNLFNPAWVINRTASGITSELQENGTIHLTGTASSSNRYVQSNDFLCLPAGTYRIRGNPVEATARKNQVKIDSNGVFTVDGKEFINFSVRFTIGDTVDIYESIILTKGSEIIDYEPYNGNTYTIDLDGTYYGGTLDVTTGVLTVTHGYVDLGTLNWGFNPDVGHQYFLTTVISNIKPPPTLGTPANLVCSHYTTDSYSGVYANTKDGTIGLSTSGRMAIFDSQKNSMTAEQFKTAMNGVQLVYELATPQTVQLTPQEVETVCGQNNIWADSGQVYVEYHFVEDFEE